MLNQFRSFSDNFFTKILLGLLILSFALWGIGDMLGTASHRQDLAVVGDHAITVDQYRRELATESEQVRRQLGASYSPELLKRLNVPQFVLQRMVQELLLQQEAARMGFIPDDTTVALEIRKTPAFLNNSGVFDKARFENTLRNQAVSEKTYVEKLRMSLATDKLLDALAVEFPFDPSMVSALQIAQAQGRNITLYKINGSTVDTIPAPTDEQLAKFHKEHANQFTLPEYRTVSFARFSAKDKVSAAPVGAEAIESYYNSHQEQFQTPEKREVEQLLYDSEEKATEAHEQAKAGKDFKDIATATNPLNRNSLSLGSVDKKGLIEGAAEEIFRLKSGGFTGPIKTAFGWHIFRVVKIEPAGTRSLSEVRDDIEKQLKQSSSENALTDRMNQLEDALAGGSTLKEAASSIGLSVEQVGTFNREGKTKDGSTANLPELDRFLDVAFKTDEKTESSVISSKGGVYYVLRVDQVIPEKLRPLTEVKQDVIDGYIRREQEKKISEMAAMIEKEIVANKPAATITANYKLASAGSGTINRSSTNFGDVALPPSFTAKIFTADIGALTSPVRSKTGDYLVAQVNSFSAAGDKGDASALKKELTQKMQEEMMTEYMRHLEKKYPVEVHQEVLEQLLEDNNDATR